MSVYKMVALTFIVSMGAIICVGLFSSYSYMQSFGTYIVVRNPVLQALFILSDVIYDLNLSSTYAIILYWTSALLVLWTILFLIVYIWCLADRLVRNTLWRSKSGGTL